MDEIAEKTLKKKLIREKAKVSDLEYALQIAALSYSSRFGAQTVHNPLLSEPCALGARHRGACMWRRPDEGFDSEYPWGNEPQVNGASTNA